MFSLQIFALIFIHLIKSDTYICDNYEECVNDDDLEVDDAISCSGYYACENSTITVIPETEDYTYAICGGSRGCYRTEFARVNETQCYGNRGCKNAIFPETGVHNRVLCNGVLGCQTATVYSGTRLLANGYKSFYYATNYPSDQDATYKVRVYGGWAAYNSYFYSNNVATYDLDFYGYYSAYQPWIVCYEDTTMTIDCNYYSCYDVTFTIIDGCDYTITCPDGTDDCAEEIADNKKFKHHITGEEIIGKQMRIHTVYEDDVTNKIGSNEEMEMGELIERDSFVTAYGNLACYNFSDCTQDFIDDTYTYVYCQGDYSCSESVITVDRYAYCSGENSCQASDINTGVGNTCHGYNSCDDAFIYNQEYVYVSGWDALTYGILVDNQYYITSTSKTFRNSEIYVLDNFESSVWANGMQTFNSAEFYALGNLTLNMRGFSAGTSSNVTCYEDSYCTIVCYYYACVDMTVYYEDGATIDITCMSNDDTYCPDEVELTSSSKSKEKVRSKILATLNKKINKHKSNNFINSALFRITFISMLLLAIGIISFAVAMVYKNKGFSTIRNTEYQPLLNN